jgi:hypothetical protein
VRERYAIQDLGSGQPAPFNLEEGGRVPRMARAVVSDLLRPLCVVACQGYRLSTR